MASITSRLRVGRSRCRNACLRLLPHALRDERVIHHHRRPHSRRGYRAVANVAALSAHQHDPGPVGHHGTRQGRRRPRSGDHEHQSAPTRAFNIPVGCVAILLLSLSIRHINHAVSVTGIVLAVIGLAGTVLSTSAEFAGSSLYLGLGAGGMERVADYPGVCGSW